jgi:8-oxoguanine deaminase
MRLGYPIAPALEARDRGIPVSIGVDGGASNDSGDMLGELRTMLYVHRIDGGHPGYGPERWINAKEVFEMATVNGAKCLNRDDIGMLKEGMAADLVLFSMIQPGYAGALTDPRGALLYCGNNHLADTTIVNGNVLIENGIFLAGDLNQIVEDANRSTARILKLVKDKTGIDYRMEA